MHVSQSGTVWYPADPNILRVDTCEKFAKSEEIE